MSPLLLYAIGAFLAGASTIFVVFWLGCGFMLAGVALLVAWEVNR